MTQKQFSKKFPYTLIRRTWTFIIIIFYIPVCVGVQTGCKLLRRLNRPINSLTNYMYLMVAKEESSSKSRHVKGLAFPPILVARWVGVKNHVKQDIYFHYVQYDNASVRHISRNLWKQNCENITDVYLTIFKVYIVYITGRI